MFFISALLVMLSIPVCSAVKAPNATRTKPTIAIFNMELDFKSGECFYEKDCAFANLSCRYLSYLNSSIIQEFYDDVDSAKQAVAHENASAAMYFSNNFTDATVAKMALGQDADDETLEQSEIRVWFDTSNQQMETSLKQDLQQAYQTYENVLSEDCESFETRIEVPFKFFKI
jgi:ABC-2 family transporter protein